MSEHSADKGLPGYRCCRHCPDDPAYHAENPPNSHDASCLTCDRDVAAVERERVLAYIESPEWASAFLAEWVKPYFGDDALDAVANVQRVMTATAASVFSSGKGGA